MAEEFHGGVCGGGNWWTSSLTTAFGSSPCSMATNGLGSFGWPIDHRPINMKTTRSSGDDHHQFSASDGSLTIQDLLSDNANSKENYPHTLQQGLNSNSSMDCSPQFRLDCPQIDNLSSRKFSGVVENSSINSIKQMSQVYQPTDFSTGLPLSSASYGYTSALLQSLMNTESKPRLPFSYNTHYWTGANEASNVIGSNFLPSAVDRKPNLSNLTVKAYKREAARELSSVTNKASNEPMSKRRRVETPSPLPTFKVRKEKLGDRVTALQQLVSPFGKTDTASVLQEAIEYIKFLHDQVGVLSTPYMKNVPQHQQPACKVKDQEGSKNDLRSRGLCLIPISSTFPIAAENTSDIWTPPFGGRFR